MARTGAQELCGLRSRPPSLQRICIKQAPGQSAGDHVNAQWWSASQKPKSVGIRWDGQMRGDRPRTGAGVAGAFLSVHAAWMFGRVIRGNLDSRLPSLRAHSACIKARGRARLSAISPPSALAHSHFSPAPRSRVSVLGPTASSVAVSISSLVCAPIAPHQLPPPTSLACPRV